MAASRSGQPAGPQGPPRPARRRRFVARRDPQPQRVADHQQRTQRHADRRQPGRHQAGGRGRNRDRVVGRLAQTRFWRITERVRRAMPTSSGTIASRSDSSTVSAAVLRQRGRVPDGQRDIGRGQHRRVVDAVAHHQHAPALRLQRTDLGQLVGRARLGAPARRVKTRGERGDGLRAVARQQVHPQACLLQAARRRLRRPRAACRRSTKRASGRSCPTSQTSEPCAVPSCVAAGSAASGTWPAANEREPRRSARPSTMPSTPRPGCTIDAAGRDGALRRRGGDQRRAERVRRARLRARRRRSALPPRRARRRYRSGPGEAGPR